MLDVEATERALADLAERACPLRIAEPGGVSFLTSIVLSAAATRVVSSDDDAVAVAMALGYPVSVEGRQCPRDRCVDRIGYRLSRYRIVAKGIVCGF